MGGGQSVRTRNRFVAQPFVGQVLGGVLVLTLAATWYVFARRGLGGINPFSLILGMVLLGSALVGGHFPIHIRSKSKLYMDSSVRYLMAGLLVPPLALTMGVAAVFLNNFLGRKRTGLKLCHILTDTARIGLVILAASIVAHLPVRENAQYVAMVAAGIVMWTGDLLSAPILFSTATGEPPFAVIHGLFKKGGLVEAALYMIGLSGILIAQAAAWGLVLLGLPIALVYIASKRTFELQDSTRQVLESMADAVDLRDEVTGGHSRRVADYTRAILWGLGRHGGEEVKTIVYAARVHDIGKIAIPDDILKGEGKLSDEERAIMEMHAEQGANLLERHPDFSEGVAIVRHHHENWDGTGYPHRLRGTEIPYGARIIAVADSYDAMTSDRTYRRGMSPAKAAAILREGRGRQWDPDVVDAFMKVLEQQHGPQVTVPLRVVTDDEVADASNAASA